MPRIVAAGLIATVTLGCLFRPVGDHGVLHAGTLVHGEVERSYFVHFPGDKRECAGSPLVLALHGGGRGDGDELAGHLGFDAIADREGFVVAYPNGLDGQWSDGRGQTARGGRDLAAVDDVGFLLAVIAELIAEHDLDENRVYVMGVSNGGMMTHRLAIEAGQGLAAIATVIANMPAKLILTEAQVALPVLVMNGTDDPIMPWGGGPVTVFGKSIGDVASTADTVDYWVTRGGLSGKPEQRTVADVDPDDGCTLQVSEWSRDDQSGAVVLYTINGGGHNLPGSATLDLPRLLGRKCQDIQAAEEIWSFFATHALSPAHGGSLSPLLGR